jgi:hypothetical protein
MSGTNDDISTTQRTSRISSEDTDRDWEPPEEAQVELETTRRSKPAAGSDTLLSAPTPGAGDDDPIDRRELEELERRLEQLEARTKVLELERPSKGSVSPGWLWWVSFMLALAVVWLVARGLP